MKKIAIFGGSFNPPGLHHRQIAELLSRVFDEVIVVPCGPRPDKQTTNDVDPIYRATMADIAFRNIANLRVELFDLEQATFTRTYQLQERYASEGEIWHVIGTDLVQRNQDNDSFIQSGWAHGQQIWQQYNFFVITRQGYRFETADLPPNHQLNDLSLGGASTLIRERIFRHEPISELVMPEIEAYIERYELYRGRIPPRVTKFQLPEPRLLIVADQQNARAQKWTQELQRYRHEDQPNCILVLGGDGMMLHAIRQHWRLRLPFLGVNAGHLGFLLNNAEDLFNGKFPPQDLILRKMPLLYVESENKNLAWQHALAFNDAWVERASSQTAWIEVKVNGQRRLEKLIADGVLISTAAGSTAYARAMGAMPLLAETPALVLVGSNVMSPPGWKSALLSFDALAEFTSLDPLKRPLTGYVDGHWQGEVLRMRVRVSRIAAAEIAFYPGLDMAEKITQLQFPLINH